MKKFDSVNMMREIRDNLSEKYIAKPELENKELEEIQQKYNILNLINEKKLKMQNM
jgi:hypothetical protein